MKVLIVDDSAVIRMMVKKMISDAYPEADITFAKDGNEALSVIKNHDFDVYTIDFNMPGADGEEVAHFAKQKSPNAKICMLTANKQQAIRDKAESIGVKFLVKPHFQNELIAFLKD